MAETPEQLITRLAQEYGVDPALALAVARQESGLNPNAHNGNGEDSWGLFQLNRAGGLGAGQAPEVLTDPEFNARVALANLARTQQANPRLRGGALAAAAQRPADQAAYARSVDAMLAGRTGMPHAGSPFSPGGAPVDDELTQEYARQVQDAQERYDQAKKYLDAIALVRQYNADKGTKTDKWLADRKLTQADLDAAKALYDEIDPDNPLTGTKELARLRQESDRAKADLNRAGAALAKAQKGTATKTPPNRVVNRNGEVITIDPTTGEQVGDTIGQERPNVASERAAAGYYDAATKHAEAQTEQAKASTARTTALTPLEVEQATVALETAKRAAAQTQQWQQAVQQALQMPPGPERTAALKQATQQAAAIANPNDYLARLQDETKLALTRAQELSRQTGNQYRLNEQTGQPEPVTDEQTGQPVPTYERAEQERQRIAHGMTAIGTLQASRQANASRAMSEFEQSGVATPGRLGGLHQMMAALPAEQYASMLGLPTTDPRVQAITQAAGAFHSAGGNGPAGGAAAGAQQQQQQQQQGQTDVAGQQAPVPQNAPLTPPTDFSGVSGLGDFSQPDAGMPGGGQRRMGGAMEDQSVGPISAAASLVQPPSALDTGTGNGTGTGTGNGDDQGASGAPDDQQDPTSAAARLLRELNLYQPQAA